MEARVFNASVKHIHMDSLIAKLYQSPKTILTTKDLATSIYTPSYISFETVLREAGVIFQHYDTIFVAGPWPLTKKIGQHTFTFRKLKDSVLYSPAGVKNENNFSTATPARAFLDMIYLFPKYYFDNLKSINWEQCFELAKIYDNQQLIKRLT